jgi:hypothetical protein
MDLSLPVDTYKTKAIIIQLEAQKNECGAKVVSIDAINHKLEAREQ